MSANDIVNEASLDSLRSPLEKGISYKGRPGFRLRALLQLERRELWIVVVYSITVGLLTLVAPMALQALVNFIAFGSLLQPLVIVTLFVLVALGFSAVLNSFRVFTVELIQQRLFVRVAADFGQRLVRVKTEAFEQFHGPELVNRFFDVVTVQKSASELLMDGLSLLMSTAAGMLLLAFFHPWLLAYDLLLLIVMLWIIFGVGRGGVKSAIQESEAKYAIAAWLEEIAARVSALKSSSGVTYALGQVDRLAQQYLVYRKAHFRVLLRQIVSSLAVQAISVSLLLGLGGYLVMRNQLTLGQLVASELVITMVVNAFSLLGKKLETYYDMLAALDKLGQVIDLPLERGGSSPPTPRESPAGIELVDVSLSPSGGEPALDQVSLCIEPGQRIGVTGSCGAGKTALTKLLYGLRHTDSGAILVDGIDARAISPEALREIAALVTGPEVVSDTIERNVSMGRNGIGLDQVHDVLERVGLLETVLALPDGLQTKLIGGVPLTSEQAERLVIARAIAGKPRLLIVDDVLDRIGDLQAFDSICKELFKPRAPWTLVCVTNRADVLEQCDRCIRMDKGKLQEIEASEARAWAVNYTLGGLAGLYPELLESWSRPKGER